MPISETVPVHVCVSSILERIITGISVDIACIVCSFTFPFTLKSPLAIIVITTSPDVPSPPLAVWLLSELFTEFIFFTVPAISDFTVAFLMEFLSFSSSVFLTLISYSALEISVSSDCICAEYEYWSSLDAFFLSAWSCVICFFIESISLLLFSISSSPCLS